MSAFLDTLLGYRVPEIRQAWTQDKTAFYALSIGLGQNPLDENELNFVDRDRPLRAVPTMACVMAYPGFWLRNPDTGIDALRIVHGGQEVELLDTLPVEGEILGRTRVTGLVDRGAEKGAILTYEREIIDLARDRVAARVRSTILLRGNGGFGGPAGPLPPSYVMPAAEPDFEVALPTRPEQALYYRMNGDYNPVHSDPAAAAAAGFARPLLHGLCTLGIACHALLRGVLNHDPSRLKHIGIRFASPVYPGDVLVTRLWRDGSFSIAAQGRDKPVASGAATYLDPTE